MSASQIRTRDQISEGKLKRKVINCEMNCLEWNFDAVLSQFNEGNKFNILVKINTKY